MLKPVRMLLSKRFMLQVSTGVRDHLFDFLLVPVGMEVDAVVDSGSEGESVLLSTWTCLFRICFTLSALTEYFELHKKVVS